mmetsp:Transcript_41827/g.106442  ORF Transcript_41827/g.106442 Transcript_41827/m.106442 type:complete len:252 (-) Transcript_41827:1126-1881(-)
MAVALLDNELARWQRSERGAGARNDGIQPPPFFITFDNNEMKVEMIVYPGLLVVLKPANLPTDFMIEYLQIHLRRYEIANDITRASRLDTDTTGVVCMALGDSRSSAANFLISQFSGRLVTKKYMALASDTFGPVGSKFRCDASMKTITSPDGMPRSVIVPNGEAAITIFEVVGNFLRSDRPQGPRGPPAAPRPPASPPPPSSRPPPPPSSSPPPPPSSLTPRLWQRRPSSRSCRRSRLPSYASCCAPCWP